MWHNNRYEHSNEIEEASLKSFGGGSGISENSHLKCELLSTKKQTKTSFTKRKKKTKNGKKEERLRATVISYLNPRSCSQRKKLKPAIHY